MTHALSGTLENNIHTLPVRVYYEDTDFSGIVYHANYLRFLERGRSDCLRCMGIHHAELADANLAWTLIRMEIDFKKPARIDDVLTVHTAYTKHTGARLYATQKITKDGTELIRAELQAACITMDGKAARIPKHVRGILERHLASLE